MQAGPATEIAVNVSATGLASPDGGAAVAVPAVSKGEGEAEDCYATTTAQTTQRETARSAVTGRVQRSASSTSPRAPGGPGVLAMNGSDGERRRNYEKVAGLRGSSAEDASAGGGWVSLLAFESFAAQPFFLH